MKISWDNTGYTITQKNNDIYNVYLGIFKVTRENISIYNIIMYKILIQI
jgi:hypothetical protein